MHNFPELLTERLILNQISHLDIPKIIKLAGNKRVSETTLNIPHPYQESDAMYWMNNAKNGFEQKTQFTFAIRIKADIEFIGGIGLKLKTQHSRATLGYWIGEQYWNNGYATEATAAILKFGFRQLELNKIYATHLVENPASGKVMINNRMIKEGELKDHTKKGNHYRSLIQYRLTKVEFENSI